MVQMNNVTMVYDNSDVAALDNFSLTINEGEFAFLVGPSGSGKTTLLIAHRISTVERLDKIIFLDDGKIEAVGPHDELYTSCPKYRRMVDLQRLEDEAGGDDNA